VKQSWQYWWHAYKKAESHRAHPLQWGLARTLSALAGAGPAYRLDIMTLTTEVLIFETSDEFRNNPGLAIPAFEIVLKADGVHA